MDVKVGDKVKITRCVWPHNCGRHGSHEGVVLSITTLNECGFSFSFNLDRHKPILRVRVEDSNFSNKIVWAYAWKQEAVQLELDFGVG